MVCKSNQVQGQTHPHRLICCKTNETLICAHPHVMWFWSALWKDYDLKKCFGFPLSKFCTSVISVKQKSISINSKPNKMWSTFLLSWEASKSECLLNDILSTADNRILGKMMGKINFKNDNGIIF